MTMGYITPASGGAVALGVDVGGDTVTLDGGGSIGEGPHGFV